MHICIKTKHELSVFARACPLGARPARTGLEALNAGVFVGDMAYIRATTALKRWECMSAGGFLVVLPQRNRPTYSIFCVPIPFLPLSFLSFVPIANDAAGCIADNTLSLDAAFLFARL